MNTFKTEITNDGFTEILVFEGNTFVKRYKKDAFGYHGLDQAWEYEKTLPDDLVLALEERDPMLIMDELENSPS